MNRMTKQEKLSAAFEQIEKTELSVNTIICGVCGNVLCFSDKETKPCIHQKELGE